MPPGSTEKKPTTDRRPLIMTATDGRRLELCLTETELSLSSLPLSLHSAPKRQALSLLSLGKMVTDTVYYVRL